MTDVRNQRDYGIAEDSARTWFQGGSQDIASPADIPPSKR